MSTAISETKRPIPENKAIETSGCPWDLSDEANGAATKTRAAFGISISPMRLSKKILEIQTRKKVYAAPTKVQ
jgi:hypothetical protein